MKEKPRFLDSENPDWEGGAELSALTHQGVSGYQGLERIDTKATCVEFWSDEVTAVCPVTGQPDLYSVLITIFGGVSIESKSLKIYFVTLRGQGIFCEDLSRKIKEDVLECVGAPEDAVSVTVTQKARGGIQIKAQS